MAGDGTVVVVDDDVAILKSLERLLVSQGYRVILFAGQEGLFQAGLPDGPACLLLDYQLDSGMNGVQVHEELLRRAWLIPTVFITAHWNARLVISAAHPGADGCLEKPFDPAELVKTVARAMQRSRSEQRPELPEPPCSGELR